MSDAHRPADEAGARLDVLHVASETITLTRTFGMVPTSRDDIVAPEVLERVVIAANAFVRAGASLDPALLEGTTLVAVKRFYAAARAVPWMNPALQATRLRERAWRCASHVAYYALQEHQRRCTAIPAIVSAMQGVSLSTIREKQYPSKEFLDAARDALKGAGLPAGCSSTAYLSNMARHAKHLLVNALRTSAREAITRGIGAIAMDLGSIVNPVIASLAAGMDGVPADIARAVSARLTRRAKDRARGRGLPAGIARAVSARLTRRAKDRARGRGLPAGRHRLDALVDAILGGSDVATWQHARRAWRDVATERMASRVRTMDVASLACSAVKDVLVRMTVDDALAAMFSTRRPPRVAVTSQVIPDSARLLRERAKVLARNRVGTALWALLAADVDAVLASIGKEPGRLVSLPRCRKQAIPVAIDDGQVYRLDLQKDPDDGRVEAATVRFSLEPGVTSTFSLRGLDRIDTMLSRGFAPARGTITRKPGGGLLLHLPFMRACTIEASSGHAEADATDQADRAVVAGVDLGLKHLAWLSIGDCRRSTRDDGSWEPVDVARPEAARYCIDQPQLVGKREAWLAGSARPPVPNLKRQLIATMKRARELQRKKDLLRGRFGKQYKHTWLYFVARREWQRCWRRVRHMHEEMARQVATRIVAACMHHEVKLLRFEDLSWSSHSAKRESGSWLASWQVHWFFSQVQERATRLARLAGIAVELADARGTSKRCSACGAVGIRDGKTFFCTNENCKKKGDSDLNGSRNVRIAPTSPRLHAKGEGARYRPLACRASTSLSLDEHGRDVQVRLGLK